MPLPSSYSESSTLLRFFSSSLKSLLFSKLILCPPPYQASPFLPLLTLLRRMKYITALYAKVHFRFMQIVPAIPVLQAANNELNTLEWHSSTQSDKSSNYYCNFVLCKHCQLQALQASSYKPNNGKQY